MVAERNPQVSKAVMKFKELSADERARDLYERREKARRDAAMFTQWEVKKKQFEMAKMMLINNEHIDKIMLYTNLEREEVENLCDAEYVY